MCHFFFVTELTSTAHRVYSQQWVVHLLSNGITSRGILYSQLFQLKYYYRNSSYNHINQLLTSSQIACELAWKRKKLSNASFVSFVYSETFRNQPCWRNIYTFTHKPWECMLEDFICISYVHVRTHFYWNSFTLQKEQEHIPFGLYNIAWIFTIFTSEKVSILFSLKLQNFQLIF